MNVLYTIMLNNFGRVPYGKIDTINKALQERSLAVFRKLQYMNGNTTLNLFS